MTATDLQNATAEDILAWTYRRFGRVALVASFQAEVNSCSSTSYAGSSRSPRC